MRRAMLLGACVVVTFVLLASCGSERPGDTGSFNGTPGTTPSFCGTPNEGCDCIDPDQVAECGKVERTGPDGYVAWVGDNPTAGLGDALARWFGPPGAQVHRSDMGLA